MAVPYVDIEEIEKHNSRADCWVVVHSKVFDVSVYLPSHPGGSEIILRYAGQDASVAYDEVHAPGIIEETLPRERFIGLLDPTKHIIRQRIDRADIENVTNTVSKKPSGSNAKPELFKLISTHDFEKVARETFTKKAFAFYSSAATDLVTHHANSHFYRRIMIRPRVLINVKDVNIEQSILGYESKAPFFVSPAAMAKLAHPNGELALAKGSASEGIIQIVSNNASFPLSSIIQAGNPQQTFFFQLYVNKDRDKTAELLHKARELGVKAIFVTVDAPVPGKREADERVAAENFSSPISGAVASNDKKGGGMGRLMGAYVDSALSWEDLPWIKQTSQLPIVLKGVQTAADVRKAVEYGVNGVFLSNHGGRSLDTAQPSILTLLELHKLSPNVFDEIQIYIDGGITRGSDILKAIALGATAVGIGRPYLYSLAYGAEGVEHLTQILKDELATSMRLCGITSLDQAHPGLLNTQDIDHLVPTTWKDHPYITWKPKSRM